MPTTDESYLATPELITERIQSIFKNRGLKLDQDRLERLIGEVQEGRTFDDIRDQLDPFATSTSSARQGRAEGNLDLSEIRDALKAISGQYGLQRGQLEAQREDAKTNAHRALKKLDSARRDELTGLSSRAAGSGLLRSGLAVKDTGRIGEQFAQAKSGVRQDRATALRAIQGNLSGLRATEKAARAAKARELARGQVGTKEAIARALKLA
jgi:hypothetical protein